MNVYKVSCFSKCGSYFASYLQSVTVTAESKGEAVQHVKAWLDKEGRGFIYPESKWNVEEIANGITSGQVVDYREDSDY